MNAFFVGTIRELSEGMAKTIPYIDITKNLDVKY